VNEPTWTIAGLHVPTSDAVGYLIDEYPQPTLMHYDCGGQSPRDRVTMSDLGRATLFGAFRGWRAAADLLTAAEEVKWPTTPSEWRLDVAPHASPAEWLSHPDVQHARELFSSLASGNQGGWREAATSKVLHMKWPRFFPVIDGELRGLYSDFAIEAERHLPGSRRRRHATTSAYWLAVRDDLLHPANQEADKATRQGLLSQRQRDHQKVDLLTQLTSLRLLDALAWAVATEKLPTTSVAST
jgi:hypothetical protein